jgi:drug/metabolite transporter (DMT)-like permease
MDDNARDRAKTATVSFGIGCILVSSVLFAPLSQTATKFLANDFPIFQILFFRSVGQTLWMLLFFWPREGKAMLHSTRPALQWTRSAVLFVSGLCWVSAISAVPLTTASAINFTAPVMVVILSIPLLGEKVGLHRWGAVLVGFAGALVIIRPGAAGVPPEVGLLVVAAALFALYQIMTRKLAGADSVATSSLYTLAVTLIVSAAAIPWHYQPPTPENTIVWLVFLVTGLFGGIRHTLVVKAYECAPASVISPFFYAELVGVTLLGFLIFDDLPDATTWTGTAIIVSSGLYIAHRERVRSRG